MVKNTLLQKWQVESFLHLDRVTKTRVSIRGKWSELSIRAHLTHLSSSMGWPTSPSNCRCLLTRRRTIMAKRERMTPTPMARTGNTTSSNQEVEMTFLGRRGDGNAEK